MQGFLCRDSGFTLVEVMVSMVIFLIASMGLLPLLLANLQANQNIGLQNRARHLTSEVMAGMQVMDYAGLDLASDIERATNNFVISQQVERDTPLSGQSRITVTTRWQQRGHSYRYQLQTIRSQP